MKNVTFISSYCIGLIKFVDWLINHPTKHWLIDQLFDQLIDWLIIQTKLIDQLINCLINWLIDYPTKDWLIDKLIGWQSNQRLIDFCITDDEEDSDEDSEDESDWDEDEDDEESEMGGYDLDVCPPGCDQVRSPRWKDMTLMSVRRAVIR